MLKLDKSTMWSPKSVIYNWKVNRVNWFGVGRLPVPMLGYKYFVYIGFWSSLEIWLRNLVFSKLSMLILRRRLVQKAKKVTIGGR